MKRVLLLAFLLALGSPAVAQNTPAGMTAAEAKKAEAYFHFTMARVLDQEQAFDDSIKEYRKALDITPNDADIYAAMARTYLNQRNREDAIKAAQKSVEINPNNLGAHKLLGDVYIGAIQNLQSSRQQVTPAQLKDTVDRAIHEFEEIVRIDPTGSSGYLMLGQLYRISDNSDKAAEIYRKFLGIEPGSEDGVVALAGLAIDSNHNAQAIELLNDFLKRQPAADRALETLGDAYSNLGETTGAADAYKRAAALNDDPDLRNKLADALLDDNRLEEAAAVFEEVLSEDQSNVGVLQKLAQIHRRQMKYSEARETLGRALRRAPTNVFLRIDMALIDRDEGKFEDAVRGFESILKDTEKPIYSQNDKAIRMRVYTQIGIIRSLQTRFDDSIAAFSSVRALADPSDRNRIDMMIADTYKEAKNIDKAESTIRAAMQESPNNRDLQMAYADILSSRGRTDESIQILQRLSAGQTPDMDLISAIIGVYEHAQRFSDAQKTLDAAARSFPDEKQIHFLQGALYERQDKVTEAEQAFRRALDLDKNNPSVLNYLGYMLADRDMKLEEALTMVKKAVDTDPINGAFLDSLGWVYFKMNRLDLAEQFLKRAVAFAATNATMYDHLGDLYYKTGRFQEAQASWTKGLQYADEPDEATRMRQKLEQVKSQASIR
jgi:tetratricopeptide (TPR) repeat protein